MNNNEAKFRLKHTKHRRHSLIARPVKAPFESKSCRYSKALRLAFLCSGVARKQPAMLPTCLCLRSLIAVSEVGGLCGRPHSDGLHCSPLDIAWSPWTLSFQESSCKPQACIFEEEGAVLGFDTRTNIGNEEGWKMGMPILTAREETTGRKKEAQMKDSLCCAALTWHSLPEGHAQEVSMMA